MEEPAEPAEPDVGVADDDGAAIAAFEEGPGVSTALPVLVRLVRHPVRAPSSIPASDSWIPSGALAVLIGWVLWSEELRGIQSTLSRLEQNPQIREALVRMGLQSSTTAEYWGPIWILGLGLVPVGLVFGAALTHLCLVAVRAGGGGSRATFRVLAYSSSGTLLSLVPILGGLLSLLWVSLQVVHGLVAVHDTTMNRVALALSLPMLLVLAAACGWMMHALQ